MSNNTKRFFRALFKSKLTIIALIIIAFFFVCAVASPLVATHNPNATDLPGKLQGASAEHWLGTDHLGRDLYSRIVYGARVAFVVGVLAVFVATVLGCTIGLVAGYFGGWVDNVLMRIIEAQMAIPPLILALALSAIFERSVGMLILILGISSIPGYARMIRSQVLIVREMDYVAASKIRGNSTFTTIVKHIFPNCISPIIVVMTQSIGGTILAEAGLSFLGAGIVPPTASWGSMVNQGYEWLSTKPLFALAPGIAVMLLVLAFNIIGNAVRDALDPRIRSQE